MMLDQDISHNLEDVKMRFIEEWDTGANPTLGDYIERYPQFSEELTEFILSFVRLEAKVMRLQEPIASPTTQSAIEAALAGACAPVTSLAEARKALRWPIARMARELNIPELLAVWLERGAIRDWPQKLEEKLADVLCTTQSQIATMLRAPAPSVAAAHFSATGKPQPQNTKTRSFEEALEYCASQGDLSDDQRREWLEASA